MATNRRQQVLLGVLAVVLLAVVYRTLQTTSATQAPASNRQTQARGGARGQQAPKTQEAPDVHLDALSGDRPKPESAQRNLFRFRPKAPPPPPPGSVVQPAAPVIPGPPAITGPPPPAPPPPIPLKFIGTVESPTAQKKVAMFSDGRGTPIYGTEGEIVLGQYRILKIGVESVEIAYLDGRGRQTIRIGGQ